MAPTINEAMRTTKQPISKQQTNKTIHRIQTKTILVIESPKIVRRSIGGGSTATIVEMYVIERGICTFAPLINKITM